MAKVKTSNRDAETWLKDKLERIARALEKAGVPEYVRFLQSPIRLMVFNFLSGIARGLGIAVGMTLIAAMVIIVITKILAHLITLPLIGEQIAQIVKLVNQYLGESSKIRVE